MSDKPAKPGKAQMGDDLPVQRFDVVAPIEPDPNDPVRKTHWVKLGVAFDANRKDGRIDVILNALPIGRRVYLWPVSFDGQTTSPEVDNPPKGKKKPEE
jgi:hypothetical protein